MIDGEEGVASNGFDLVDDDCLLSKASIKGDLHFNTKLKTIKIDVGTGELGMYLHKYRCIIIIYIYIYDSYKFVRTCTHYSTPS
jgi:hypothetical protein